MINAFHSIPARARLCKPCARTALIVRSSPAVSHSSPSGSKLAGFNENRANTLLIEGGKLTGKVSEPVLGRQAKIEALEEITARLGITPNDALAVGDGANDLGMIGVAGLGVAYHAKPVVAETADAAINHGDLTALLYLQGYRDSDFIT